MKQKENRLSLSPSVLAPGTSSLCLVVALILLLLKQMSVLNELAITAIGGLNVLGQYVLPQHVAFLNGLRTHTDSLALVQSLLQLTRSYLLYISPYLTPPSHYALPFRVTSPKGYINLTSQRHAKAGWRSLHGSVYLIVDPRRFLLQETVYTLLVDSPL